MFKWQLSGLLFGSISTFAQVIEPLDFGTLVIVQNNQESSISVFHDGRVVTSGLYTHTRGHPALLIVDSLQPNSRVYISDNVSQVRLNNNFDNQHFIVEKLLYRQSHITDQHGELELSIGAMLKTSANGRPYYDGQYSCVLEISVDY
ncbi:hypothetical protein PSECIP111951_03511 [Pseudoalteromonas holothuriae]|uniref:DUF4402 domain-containing protein n=1 Tax=Pseudoalteromonas holothuriae TaxID=2963714 RepID=A0ABN8UQA7_9GAMM|nr:DUF4402 domain-containing protein [Pseudoalteromonas sp. CIP111951]CAH9066145.1 hypothetical protein PSECIP111951_03511 [Pseudoalteromonas sp. CIP111951]